MAESPTLSQHRLPLFVKGELPIERLLLMLQYLENDPVYADEYEHFVTGMSYAAEDERSSFSQALDTARHIVSRIESAFARK